MESTKKRYQSFGHEFFVKKKREKKLLKSKSNLSHLFLLSSTLEKFQVKEFSNHSGELVFFKSANVFLYAPIIKC